MNGRMKTAVPQWQTLGLWGTVSQWDGFGADLPRGSEKVFGHDAEEPARTRQSKVKWLYNSAR